MRSLFIIGSLLLLGAGNMHGQTIGPSTLNATGGSKAIGTNVYDWSVGEMTLVSTATGSNIIITQGVLQNDEHGSGVAAIPFSTELQVFPNPASTQVNIRYNALLKGELSYRLMDIAGRTIVTKTVQITPGTEQLQVDIAHLAAAAYMLNVSFTSAGATVNEAAYKIQKLN